MTIQEMNEDILYQVQKTVLHHGHAVIAIDGRCASGKSTLAAWLQESTDANLIHLDDFFLRKEQRNKERFTQPGENVDHERFLDEVLLPLHERKAFSYRPFDCASMSLQEEIKVPVKQVNIIEGSYCMREDLREYYDLKIFLKVSPAVQMQRIQKRDPKKAEDFRLKWIPLEEEYFKACRIEEVCDETFDTSLLF
jgi:uridine kinase